MRGAGLITVTHVRVSGDLRHAWALFTVHDAGRGGTGGVRQGLNNASGYFRQAIARRLRMKVAPAVKFEVDTCSSRPNASRSCCAKTKRRAPTASRRRRRAGRDATTSMMTAATNSAGAAAGRHRRGAGVDKPLGPTSFDVVRQACGAAPALRRVGHGGTLDPAASGVLPICLGEATKLAQFLLDADKEYDVHGLLRRRDRHRRRGRRGHRAPRRGRRRRGGRAAARWRRSAARSRRCRRSTRRSSGRGARSMTTRAPARRSRSRRAAWSCTSWR